MATPFSMAWLDRVFHGLFLCCALLTTLAVGAIGVFIVYQGLPALEATGLLEFIRSSRWQPPAYFGIGSMIISSAMATAGALVIGVPLGLLTALFLAEIAPDRLAGPLRSAIELLAGIPSVIYGFFALVVLVPLIERSFAVPAGNSLLAGILVLAIMILPTVIVLSETAIRAVPRSYREASLALGASPLFTLFRVVLPAARSGLLTATLLGVARAMGETMAIIMVMGNATAMPGSLLDPARTLTANIALEMSYASGLHGSALYATGVVLFIFIMLLNALLLYLNKKKAGDL